MRKAFKWIFLIGISAVVVLLIYQILNKQNHLTSARQNRQNWPSDVAFIDLNGNKTLLQEVHEDSLLAIYFNPDCGHCQDFGKAVKQQQAKFSNHQFVWVSPANTNEISAYRDTILHASANHVFLRDTSQAFYKAFGYQTFPSILVYHHGRLFRAYQADIKLDLLLP